MGGLWGVVCVGVGVSACRWHAAETSADLGGVLCMETTKGGDTTHTQCRYTVVSRRGNLQCHGETYFSLLLRNVANLEADKGLVEAFTGIPCSCLLYLYYSSK